MDWSYDAWPSGEPYDWGGAARGMGGYAQRDFHVDLGCGTVKKGRIGIDRYPAPGVNVVMDLNTGVVLGLPEVPGADAHYEDVPLERKRGLPFEDSSIESVISHHCLEHVGDGFIPLVDEVYRVLKPGGLFYAITPLFPSRTAVEDPDHRRFFMEGTWDAFCGHLGSADNPTGCWCDSFSVPYTKARFTMLNKEFSPRVAPDQQWGEHDAREIRAAMEAVK